MHKKLGKLRFLVLITSFTLAACGTSTTPPGNDLFQNQNNADTFAATAIKFSRLQFINSYIGGWKTSINLSVLGLLDCADKNVQASFPGCTGTYNEFIVNPEVGINFEKMTVWTNSYVPFRYVLNPLNTTVNGWSRYKVTNYTSKTIFQSDYTFNFTFSDDLASFGNVIGTGKCIVTSVILPSDCTVEFSEFQLRYNSFPSGHTTGNTILQGLGSFSIAMDNIEEKSKTLSKDGTIRFESSVNNLTAIVTGTDTNTMRVALIKNGQTVSFLSTLK